MSFNFAQKESIKVISMKDSSLNKDDSLYPQGFDEAWKAYQKNLDESLLVFMPDAKPTRFVLALSMNHAALTHVENSKIKIDKGQAAIQLSYLLEEIRVCLTDIENPCGKVQFKKDKSDGFADKELIAFLSAVKILPELIEARNLALNDDPAKDTEQVKKN